MFPSDGPQAGAAIALRPTRRLAGWGTCPLVTDTSFSAGALPKVGRIECRLDATEQELEATVPHLWLVEHRAPGLAQPLRVGGITIPSRPCTTPACNRCTQLWGGYQFRWIDARWLDKYETMRRPGSWSSVQVERLRT